MLLALAWESAQRRVRKADEDYVLEDALLWWLPQVGNLLLVFWFVASLLMMPDLGYGAVREWLGHQSLPDVEVFVVPPASGEGAEPGPEPRGRWLFFAPLNPFQSLQYIS